MNLMTVTFQTPKPRIELREGLLRPSREKSENRTEQQLWLDKNENRDPEYIEFLKKNILDIPVSALFSYPDCFFLYQKLAGYLQVAVNQLIVAAGSDGIIRAVYEAFIAPGDTVLYTEPTFAMYSLYAKMYGAKSVLLHYEASAAGPVLPLKTLLEAIVAAQPRVVCLPNPNSPTGTVYSSTALRAIIAAAGEVGAVILIDEAYYPFYDQTVLPWITEYPHLIVARTFSKAWGLAGIRLGYGVASAALISQLHKIRPMYEAGALSIFLAEKVLDYAPAMLAAVQRLNDGKKYFLAAMQALGFNTLASEGNFLHVAFQEHAQKIHAALENRVLYRPDFSHPALSGYSRFSATTRELFLPVVAAIKQAIE